MLPLRALWDGSSWGQDAGELDENELLWKVEACSDLRGAKSAGEDGGRGGRCWEMLGAANRSDFSISCEGR